jgi:hypothetical protein
MRKRAHKIRHHHAGPDEACTGLNMNPASDGLMRKAQSQTVGRTGI